ncbi:MAG: hypothetical protein ACYDDV_00760 [Methanoregula sp.]
MKNSWWGWLDRDDDPCSRSYDFIEVHPIWEMWWFRIGGAAAGICLLWFFWSVL